MRRRRRHQPRDPARAPTEKEKRLFRLEDAVFAGRVLAADALATLGTYQQSATGTRLCTSAGFGVVRDSVCNAADILGKAANEPLARCDALSAAIGFVAVPVVQSYVSDAAAPPTGCESLDAAILTCP